MSIYITKNNQQFGPFDEAKILEMLHNGQLSPNDLAIRLGESQWQPLGVLFPNFNSQPKVRKKRSGAGSFLLILGIVVFLIGTTLIFLRPTYYQKACARAEQLFSEMKQAREKFEADKTEENLKDFEDKRSNGRIWAKGCDEAVSSYRFWIAIYLFAAVVGLMFAIIGFFMRR